VVLGDSSVGAGLSAVSVGVADTLSDFGFRREYLLESDVSAISPFSGSRLLSFCSGMVRDDLSGERILL